MVRRIGLLADQLLQSAPMEIYYVPGFPAVTTNLPLIIAHLYPIHVMAVKLGQRLPLSPLLETWQDALGTCEERVIIKW